MSAGQWVRVDNGAPLTPEDVWQCDRCDGTGNVPHHWGDGAPCPWCYDPDTQDGTGYIFGYTDSGAGCAAKWTGDGPPELWEEDDPEDPDRARQVDYLSCHQVPLEDEHGDLVDVALVCSDTCHRQWCAANGVSYGGWYGAQEYEFEVGYRPLCANCGGEL